MEDKLYFFLLPDGNHAVSHSKEGLEEGTIEITKEEFDEWQATILAENLAETQDRVDKEDVIYKMASLLLKNKPVAEKVGMKLELTYFDGGFAWEYVPDPNAKGTQDNPFPYTGKIEDGIDNAWYVDDNGVVYIFMSGEYVEL